MTSMGFTYFDLVSQPLASLGINLIHPTAPRALGLKQLLDAQQLCDVTLLVEGKKFMCHRYDHHILDLT